jgi:hypothetical protein
MQFHLLRVQAQGSFCECKPMSNPRTRASIFVVASAAVKAVSAPAGAHDSRNVFVDWDCRCSFTTYSLVVCQLLLYHYVHWQSFQGMPGPEEVKERKLCLCGLSITCVGICIKGVASCEVPKVNLCLTGESPGRVTLLGEQFVGRVVQYMPVILAMQYCS